MNMDDIPLWLLFVLTTLLIVAAIEGGYKIGKRARLRSENEKEAPVGAIVGTVLALLAFMLAFTFGIVSDRYDARKALVRDQAAAISTSYSRSDFLPDPLRSEAKSLYNDYVALLIESSKEENVNNLPVLISDLRSTQGSLWDIAVENVRLGDNSDISAMYAESLTTMNEILIHRLAVAVQSRIPTGVWVALYLLIVIGMLAVGYQTAIAESGRTWAMLLLALAFSMVIVLIAALDDPERGYLPVSQRPLLELQASMSADTSP